MLMKVNFPFTLDVAPTGKTIVIEGTTNKHLANALMLYGLNDGDEAVIQKRDEIGNTYLLYEENTDVIRIPHLYAKQLLVRLASGALNLSNQ